MKNRLFPLFCLVFVLAPSLVMGEGAWFYWNDFSGGLNVNEISQAQPSNSMIVLQNAFTKGTKLNKIGGFVRRSNISAPIKSFTSYYNDSSNVKYLLASTETELYASSNAGYTFTTIISYPNLWVGTGGLQFTEWHHKLFIANRKDVVFGVLQPVLIWNGTNFLENSFMPSSAFVKEQANVLWCAGFADAPKQVWVSEPGSDSVFGDFIFDVHGARADKIMGVFDIQNYMIFVMGSGITQVYGNTNETFGQTPLVYGSGMKSVNSFFKLQSGFVGWTDNGFFFFDGGKVNHISDPIDPMLRDSVYRPSIQTICGVAWRDGLLVAVPFGWDIWNTRVFWMNTQTGAWTEWKGSSTDLLNGLSIGAFRVLDYPEGTDTLLWGTYQGMSGTPGIFSYKKDYDSLTDMIAQTPFIDAGEATAEKQLQQYYVDAAFDYGNGLKVSFYKDYNMTTALWVDTILSITPASRSAIYITDCKASVYGKNISMRVQSLHADTTVISRMGMMLAPAREVRDE